MTRHRCGACGAPVVTALLFPENKVIHLELAAAGAFAETPTLFRLERPIVKRVHGEWSEHKCNTGRGTPSFSAANFKNKRRPTP